MQSKAAAITTHPRKLCSTEWRLVISLHRINTDISGTKPSGYSHRSGGIAAEDVVVEPEDGAVSYRNSFLFLIERNRHNDWAENLFLGHCHFRGDL